MSSQEELLNQLEKSVLKLKEQADEQLDPLRVENAKLKYRRDFLKRSIEEAIKVHGNSNLSKNQSTVSLASLEKILSTMDHTMINISYLLADLFSIAIQSAFPELTSDQTVANVQPSKKEQAYQLNSSMKIAGMLKSHGKTLNGVQVADEIAKFIPPNEIIESVKNVSGFLIVTIKPSFASKIIKKSLINGIKVTATKQDRVVIDYSSPNIAKEMHVGHLRSTIIGDALANILEFLGHSVLRVNHVGDWGTQFGMLLAHLKEKYPDFKTCPPPISDLQSFYREAKKRFDEEEPFKKEAYAAVVKLQSKEPDMIQAWQLICNISRKEFEEVYALLGVKGLVERGESFYHDLMDAVVKDLTERGFLVEEEGRKLFYPKSLAGKKTTIPLTVVKSDGGYTYDTSDMACIKYRIENDKGTRLIYVTDLGQALHFEIVFACGRECGYVNSDVKTEHVGFGVVLGEGKKKFKTRSGETVRLKDLLQEGRERARQKLIEKERDKVLTPDELNKAELAVSIGCIKYADLRSDRGNDYVFSFDRMLDDRGNTAVYLLYQLTRIKSIKRNANIDTPTSELAKQYELPLGHEKEYKLALQLLKFAEVMGLVSNDLAPHLLCTYLYELSGVFSEFYDKCYVINKLANEEGVVETKINYDRVLLCEATAAILEKGLNLLGISSVEKM